MEEVKERRTPGPMDAELKAIQQCLRAMKSLSPTGKFNVCRYLTDRMNAEAAEQISGPQLPGSSTEPEKQPNLFR